MLQALQWAARSLPAFVRHLFSQLTRRSLSEGVKSMIATLRQTTQSSESSEVHLVKVVQGMAKHATSLSGCHLQRFGEDAWCTATTPQSDVLVVADGVGSWRELGIDSGAFAMQLLNWCAYYAKRAQYKPNEPKGLLNSSYQEVMEQKYPILGGCTACIVSVDRQQRILYSANLGDSGYMVVRNGQVLHRSQEQLHRFNTPFQLSVPPDAQRLLVHCDLPEMAQTQAIPVCIGDIILVATDGLFDNVPEHMLLQELKKVQIEPDAAALQRAADTLVLLARHLSCSKSHISPFALKAKEYNRSYKRGGKPDDITVMLAAVALPT